MITRILQRQTIGAEGGMDSLPAGKISTDWGSAAPGFIYNFI